MKTMSLWVCVVAFAIGGGAIALTALAANTEKPGIEALEKRFVAAVEKKDVDGIMANYVPGDELLVFDLIPPREYKGSDAYKKDWQGVLGGCADNPKMEMSDLVIEGGSEYAFGHNIQHFMCTDPKGNKLDLTMRVTDAYKKVKGKWLIVHEHISVPVDLATAKADLTSKP